MKKSILWRFAAILVLALALSSVISSFLLGKNMFNENQESMLQTLSVVDYSLDYEKPLEEQVKNLRTAALGENTRITIINKEGKVLADTGVSTVDSLENHLEREEVRAALEHGKGYASRFSKSMGRDLFYVAILSERGDCILRMSVPYHNALDYMIILLPILLIAMVVAFGISVVVAAQFSDKLVSAEISRQMEQVEKDKKIRQEFFGNASHELKTPITSVRGYAELLCQDFAQDEATRRDFLNRILIETDHMAGLIDDILMISRLESKDAEVTLSKVQLQAVVAEVLKSLAPQAAACQISLTQDCADISIQASVQQIRELLLNLIGNGIKYNHPGGHVHTRVWQDKSAVWIEVSDDGCGIAKEDQKRVFERFYRVDKGRSKKMGGTGLGLSIVKHIAAYYGGEVQLTSELGEGSKFLVMIPLSGINSVEE